MATCLGVNLEVTNVVLKNYNYGEGGVVVVMRIIFHETF